jgi:hypothetical protein
VPDFSDLSLLPFCVGLTLLGLIGSYAAAKRRGAAAGARGLAWSLLPVSLYLTGLLELVWDVVKATGDWVVNLVFSPSVWAGVALFGVSVVLFVLSGVARNRGIGTKGAKPEKKATDEPSAAKELTATGPEPAKVSRKKKPAEDAGEFDEIEDILKRHGIN